MVFSIHIPDKKQFDKFKDLLKEAKQITGAPYHRTVITAVTFYIIKLRKESR
jgi:hypothetical protein